MTDAGAEGAADDFNATTSLPPFHCVTKYKSYVVSSASSRVDTSVSQ